MKALYEKIVPPESNSFKAYSYTKKEFDNPWHYHPEYELTYIVSSQGVRYTGNSFENFTANDFVLLGPNLPHCWKNTGPQKQKASAIVIHFESGLLGDGWTAKREFQSIQKLLLSSEKGIQFDPEIAVSMKERLDHFLGLSSFDKLIALLEILHELSVTKKTKILCDWSFKDDLNLDEHERINMIYHFVRSHYTEKFSLADIANAVHMGAESFSRFFSKTMKKPFFSFLNEYRINAACKLLIESDLPVTDICYTCGFESLPFFYRQFKKYKNNSPHQYRVAYQRISI